MNFVRDYRRTSAAVEKPWRLGLWRFAFAIFLVSATNSVTAQSQSSAVTVNQTVQEAIEKNLTLLAERYNLSIADTRILTAGLRPNPVLSFGGDHLDLLGTGYNDINAEGPPEYSIRTDFIFEHWQKRRYRVEVAQQEKAVAQLQLLNATRSLMLDVQNVRSWFRFTTAPTWSTAPSPRFPAPWPKGW